MEPEVTYLGHKVSKQGIRPMADKVNAIINALAAKNVSELKCYLVVTYLGHKVSKQGIRPIKDKVNAITNALAPKNVSELKCYLGMINYYQTFLPTLSCVSTPLQKLLRRKVHWHKEQQLNSLRLSWGNRVVISLKN